MRVEILLDRDVRENAALYYVKAKKFRKKLGGLQRGVAELRRKIAEEKSASHSARKEFVRKREKEWYEKFHWFFTSEGFLVIGGKDAKSNELIVTRFMERGDVYFHADIHGAGHVVLKTSGRGPGENSMKEASVFAGVFSSAWREKLPAVDVFSARPEQVTKQAPSGEAIGMGAFMVYGEREWFKKTPLEFAIGYKVEGEKLTLHSGPPSAIRVNCDFFVGVKFGNDSKGDAAKKILRIFSSRLKGSAGLSLDDIVALLPSGGIRVVYPGGK